MRALLLALVWWVLVGSVDGYLFGSVAVAMIAVLSLRLTPPSIYFPRLGNIPGFLVFFLHHSLLAGCDVARRTLTPTLPLYPAILTVPLTLPAGPPTWLLMLLVSLLPGTLTISLAERTLELHCLDHRQKVREAVVKIEQRIAWLFDCAAPSEDS